jgi:hypothetical protein
MTSRCGPAGPTHRASTRLRGSPRQPAAPPPSPTMAPGSLRLWRRPRPPYTTASRLQSSGSSSSLASSPPRCRPPGRTCRSSRSHPRRRRRMLLLLYGTSTLPPPSISTTRRACPRPRGSCASSFYIYKPVLLEPRCLYAYTTMTNSNYASRPCRWTFFYYTEYIFFLGDHCLICYLYMNSSTFVHTSFSTHAFSCGYCI